MALRFYRGRCRAASHCRAAGKAKPALGESEDQAVLAASGTAASRAARAHRAHRAKLFALRARHI